MQSPWPIQGDNSPRSEKHGHLSLKPPKMWVKGVEALQMKVFYREPASREKEPDPLPSAPVRDNTLGPSGRSSCKY